MDAYEQGMMDKLAGLDDNSRLWDYLATAVSPTLGHGAMGAIRAPEGKRIKQTLKGGLAGAGGLLGGAALGGAGGAGLGALLGMNRSRDDREALMSILGVLGAGTGGLVGSSELGRKVTTVDEPEKEEPEEEAPKQEESKEEVPEQEKESAAYDQGFIDKCAERGVDPEAVLEKVALPTWAIKGMSKLPTSVLRGMGNVQQYGKGVATGAKADLSFLKALLKRQGVSQGRINYDAVMKQLGEKPTSAAEFGWLSGPSLPLVAGAPFIASRLNNRAKKPKETLYGPNVDSSGRSKWDRAGKRTPGRRK